MPWNLFKAKQRKLAIMATCPQNCADLKQADIVIVSVETVKENLGISGDMRMQPESKLLHCRCCGCVWLRTFNADSLKFHDEVLGTF